MHVDQTLICRNPQTAIPIPEHTARPRVSGGCQVGRKFVVPQPTHPKIRRDDNRASIVLLDALDPAALAGERVETAESGFPAPKAFLSGCPEIALAVLVKREDDLAELGRAAEISVPNRANPSFATSELTRPKDTFAILEQREAAPFAELRMIGESSVLPTIQTPGRADPQRPVTRDQQACDEIR
jgi:hypothetical protein